MFVPIRTFGETERYTPGALGSQDKLICSYTRASVDLAIGYTTDTSVVCLYMSGTKTARNFPNRFGLPWHSYLMMRIGLFCGRLEGSARLNSIVLVVRPMPSSIPGA
jgi:hypothetical protein